MIDPARLAIQEPLDARRQERVDALRREAQCMREFLSANAPRCNRKGQKLETNLADPRHRPNSTAMKRDCMRLLHTQSLSRGSGCACNSM